MTTLSSLKKQIRPLPETQNLQLLSTEATTTKFDDLNYSESKSVTVSDNKFYPYRKISDESEVFACSSINSVKHKNVNDRINNLEPSRPPVPQNAEFSLHNLEIPENLVKSKHFDNIDRKECSSPESFKTDHKLITDSKSKPKNAPDSSFFEHVFTRARDGNLLKAKSSDSVREEKIASEPKEGVSPCVRQNFSSLKRTDNVQPNQVKTKLRSMWNNMKYGWRVKREVNLKVDSAAWLLGRCYHNKLNESTVLSQDVSKQLKLDLLSKIWLTYRINFPTIPGTEFVSDSGWGCMLRCGQMMMAQALVCHFLHRDWRISSDQPDETKNLYKMILRWFGDSLSDTSPFSLHQLVSLGVNYGRKAGDWYGPTHVAQVLRDALFLSQSDYPQLRDVCMYVALDGIVFKQDVEDLCCGSSKYNFQSSDTKQRTTSVNLSFSSDDSQKRPNLITENNSFQGTNLFHSEIAKGCLNNFEDACPSYSEFGPPSFNSAQKRWKSLILFVSVRLGNDKINPFYIPCLKSLLAYEHCIGIIGGRPKHALYFIGWQEEKLIHLDPHSCQPAVDMEKDDFNEKSFHSSSIRTISFTEMDPSCAIGFYFRMEEEFQHFVEKFSEITAPMKRNLDYPVFALAEGRRIDVEEIDSYTYTRSSFSNTSNGSYKEEDDDYILL